MATKNQPGEFDCYGAADPDEPIFILRSTDRLAPLIVETWAAFYRFTKKQINDEEGESMTPDQARKYTEALNTARAMREWREKLDQEGR